MEPGDGGGCFGLVRSVVEAVVVGEGDVEGIEFGDEVGGAEAGAGGGVRVVVAPEIFLPLAVPGGVVVGGVVAATGFFADPEDGGGDVLLPRVGDASVVLRVGWRGGGGDDLRFRGGGEDADAEDGEEDAWEAGHWAVNFPI